MKEGEAEAEAGAEGKRKTEPIERLVVLAGGSDSNLLVRSKC